MAEHRLGVTGAQHVGVVDRVAPGQRGMDQGHGLVADVGVPWRIPQVDVLVEELPQTQVLGQRGGQDQPGVGHEALVVEGHLKPVQAVA